LAATTAAFVIVGTPATGPGGMCHSHARKSEGWVANSGRWAGELEGLEEREGRPVAGKV